MQYLPIIITALLGVFALIAKTNQDGNPGYLNKLTPFGIIVFFLLIASFVTSIWLQHNTELENEQQKQIERKNVIIDSLKEREKFKQDSIGYVKTISSLEFQKQLNLKKIVEDSIRYMVTLSKFSQQLSYQSQALFDIQKVLHPIRNIKFSYQIEISSGNSQRFKQYFKRLKNGIDSLMPSLNNSNKPVDGISVAGLSNDIPYQYRIARNSSLFPISTDDKEDEIYYLSNLTPTLNFYKIPVNILATQLYVQSNNIEEAVFKR